MTRLYTLNITLTQALTQARTLTLATGLWAAPLQCIPLGAQLTARNDSSDYIK